MFFFDIQWSSPLFQEHLLYLNLMSFLLWFPLHFPTLSTLSKNLKVSGIAFLTFMKRRMLKRFHKIHDMYTATSWSRGKVSYFLCDWPWKETGHLQHCRQAELKWHWQNEPGHMNFIISKAEHSPFHLCVVEDLHTGFIIAVISNLQFTYRAQQ